VGEPGLRDRNIKYVIRFTFDLVILIGVAATFPNVLRTERGQEAQDSHLPSRRIGAAQWIASGIELEHNMCVFQLTLIRY
jgi:hypothetical protein